MSIEKITVNKVRTVISKVYNLEEFISAGDREPSWDGFIYVYKNAQQSKDNILGRVAVQVKGHKAVVNTMPKETIETSDLKNYMNDSGCLYIVGYIDEHKECELYYTSLLPFYIKELLIGKDHQRTVNVPLKPFPTEERDISRLLVDFVRDKNKQSATINTLDLKDIKGMKETGDLVQLGFSFTDRQDFCIEDIFKKEFYLYGKLKNGVTVTVGRVSKVESIEVQLDDFVSCGGVVFYDKYTHCINDSSNIYKFGKTINLVVDKNSDNIKLDFNVEGSLDERINDEKFLLAMLNAKSFNVGSMRIDGIADKKAKAMLKEHSKILLKLENLKKVLSLLNISKEIDLISINDDDLHKIDIIINAFLYNKSVKLSSNQVDKYVKATFKISNIKILLLATKADNNDRYKLQDYFDGHIKIEVKNDDGKLLPSSLYTTLTRKDFAEYCNIDYKKLYSDITNITYSSAHAERVLPMLLEMLHAYDLDPANKCDMLDCAIRIAEWLKEKNNDLPNTKLNYLQAIKRKRDLFNEEQKVLNEIILDKQSELMQLIAAALLLDQQSLAESGFDKLNDEEKIRFQDFPIFKFWKQL